MTPRSDRTGHDPPRIACIFLPAFPLQIASRGHEQWRGRPAAVVSDDKPTAFIEHANREAWERGVRPGIRYAAALSLVATLQARAVPAVEVERTVSEVTEVLRDFSPEVEPQVTEPGIFLVNLIGLGGLFPSLDGWRQTVEARLGETGLQAVICIGFSRFGTYAAAKSSGASRIFATAAEEETASAILSLDYLPLPPTVRERLTRLGVTTVRAVRALPAGSLIRRFGREAAALVALVGDAETDVPIQPIFAEEPVRRSVRLADRESNLLRLIELVVRMSGELVTEVDERSALITALEVQLLLDDDSVTETEIRPAAPTLERSLLADLIDLRVGSLQLSDGVVEVTVEARAARVDRRQLELFRTESGRDTEAALTALARIRAELGDDAVGYAETVNGHAPEGQFRWVAGMPPSLGGSSDRGGTREEATMVRRLLARPLRIAPPVLARQTGSERPPERSTRRSKRVVSAVSFSGPYVVSGGWWRRHRHREYFYVETGAGELLWIFRDRTDGGWYLQGRVE